MIKRREGRTENQTITTAGPIRASGLDSCALNPFIVRLIEGITGFRAEEVSRGL